MPQRFDGQGSSDPSVLKPTPRLIFTHYRRATQPGVRDRSARAVHRWRGHGHGTFNIGNQQAGAIYQATGDQTIHHGEGEMSIEPLSDVSELRATVEAAGLRPDDERDALEALDGVETELRGEAPEKSRVAGNLQRLARVLEATGDLAGATHALRRLATWLGPADPGSPRSPDNRS